MAVRPKLSRILLVAASSASFDATLAQIKEARLDVAIALTADQAVAVCLGSHFAAVVLDAALIRKENWSVAKSIKLVKPALPILLLDSRAVAREGGLPAHIEALATHNDPGEVLLKLKQLLQDKTQTKTVSRIQRR